MFKRVALFLATNLLVVITLSIVMNLLGVRPYLSSNGIDYNALLAFCFIWGMGGAFISLALSRVFAKWRTGMTIIDPANPGQFAGLVEMVKQLSQAAQLPAVPQIGIYDSPEINAFATGPTKRRSLVAFSTGILRGMNKEELAGVAGHEIAHIKNGDMVTMTLLQGVINAFVMFLARVIGFAISQAMKKEDSRFFQAIVVFVLDIVFTMLGMIIVCWFSRTREYRADAGSAKIGGRQRMISALEALKGNREVEGQGFMQQDPLAAFKISGGKAGWGKLFSTHPDLDDRIAHLQKFQ